jgi:3-oxoacyl-[acyl-carrier-protein] synthase III
MNTNRIRNTVTPFEGRPTATGAGITGIAYAFPAEARSVSELAAAGALRSDPAVLRSFGFEQVHTAATEAPFDLALSAARALLERDGIDPESIDLVLYGGAPAGHAEGAGGPGVHSWETLSRFRYPATRLQHELGLTGAAAFSVGDLACTTMFGAVNVAAAFCRSGGARRVLCVTCEFFPREAGREELFTCTSDAACAVLVEGDAHRGRIRGFSQITQGYYWESERLRDEIVASYFPVALRSIDRALADAGWQAGDVDWVIPHNVGRSSWGVLTELAGLTGARIWEEGLARDGHTLAGDNFINLADSLSAGAVRPGDRLLLFSYGYGAHWMSLALEA